ncbi:MFS transporter [Streptomyces aureoverticillatus]|uniref:MFS transporter n=1 Tax=Streptomyces aureoverticillatus TaxID=66871 RepID=UPI0013DC49BA|nr:MFS transporter [Streptomyces aureoverticillatus]QIB42667.1 MFS transporter [Streptomyces aureoverticillatus]
MAHDISWRDYRELLSQRAYRSTLAFSALARLPFAMVSLAVLFHAQERSGSFAWAGALSSAMLAGTALGSVVQGKLIDASGPTRPLFGACLVFAPCTAVLMTAVHECWGGPWPILLAGCVGFSQPNVAAASRAVWGRVVTDPAHVTTGAAYEALSLEVAFVLGPGLVGAFAMAGYSAAGLATSATLMIAGTLGFLSSALVRRWPTGTADRRASRRRGALGSLRQGALRALVTASAGLGLCLGGVEVAVPAAMRAQGSPGLGGLLLSGWTITSLLFAIPYGTRPVPRALEHRVPALLAGFAVLVIATAVPRSPLGITLAVLLAGCLIAVQPTTHSLTLQTVVPREEIAQGFAWIITSMTLGAAAGQSISGHLVEQAGPRPALAAVGALGLLAAAAVTLQRAALRAPRATP